MTDTAKQAKNRYAREWRKNNPEKVKAYQERYWKKQEEKLTTKAGETA